MNAGFYWPPGIAVVSPAFIEQNTAYLDRMASYALMHPTPHHTPIRQMMAVQRFNTYARLGQILASTLILTGRDDRVIPPANSYLLAHRIPRARLHVIPDAGHGFFWEKVDLLT